MASNEGNDMANIILQDNKSNSIHEPTSPINRKSVNNATIAYSTINSPNNHNNNDNNNGQGLELQINNSGQSPAARQSGIQVVTGGINGGIILTPQGTAGAGAGQTNINDLGYYRPHANDPNFDYDENMLPWINNEDEFLFYCNTTRALNAQINIKSQRSLSNLNNNTKKSGQLSLQSGTTIYHRKGSKRLIIKQREKESLLALSKKKPLLGLAIILLIVGILFLLSSILNGYFSLNTIIGLILIILSIILFCCKKNQTNELNSFIYTTQSIPLNSIHYIDRQLENYDTNKIVNNCCNNCCGVRQDIGIKLSEITIGYNRSNISKIFSITGGLVNNTEDTIKLTLNCIDAYNLHQYLNGIIDGKNMMQYNNEISRHIHFNPLPTK